MKNTVTSVLLTVLIESGQGSKRGISLPDFDQLSPHKVNENRGVIS